MSHEFQLREDQVETFHRDGFVIVENLVDPELAGARSPATRTCLPGPSKPGSTPMSGTGGQESMHQI